MPAWHGRTCLSTGVIRDNEPVVFFLGGGEFFSSIVVCYRYSIYIDII